ncbi:class I adenylate-forming enzyme family protein [Halorientalis regularis]|uniref:Crotonobetaine/carnitine-CoA ligase n=1 Tax=Halorientalis regularis TaxID=660518 RepID=A0A1G7JZM9_9EURY|nr:AMP-binding protein [Halorientalis regularis]SDF30357.1 crotonobetaine/carnitine-CoA ligase [Halorientalis regularis]
MRIEELLETRTEKTPAKPFLTFPDEAYTYREVTVRSKRYASALADLGVDAGDPVALFLPNTPEFLFCLFGCAYRDAVAAPSNPAYTARELEHALSLSRPDLLVTTPDLAGTARAAAEETTVERIVTTEATADHDSLPALADDQSPEVADHGGDAESIGLHMYTSGTTGPPKAVECQHENWTISAVDFQKRMGFTHDDTLFTALPLFHANAQIYSTLGAAAAGAEVVIYEDFSTSNWWDWCREHGVTEFNAMGSMLKMLDNVPEQEDDADNPVELVFSAGTPPDLIEPFEARFDLRVVEGYSLTEDPMLVLNPTDPEKRKVGSIGLPPAEKRIRVVDEDGDPVDPGERGEIVQDCPALMAGYHRQPEKTDEAIRDGWFHTGDYGKIDEDGFVYFLDRKKDIVRRGGENISSFEVEGVIKALSAVDEVAVIPSPDEFYGEVVKAMVRRKEGHDLAPEDVVAACRGELASYKLPEYVEFVDDFPYTPTGKIQKQQLRERERSEEPDHWAREGDAE